MDKYCTFKKSSTRYVCGQTAAAPHPVLPNQTLCRQHANQIKAFLTALTALKVA